MTREELLEYRKILLEMKKKILERFFKQEETEHRLTEESQDSRDLEEYAYIDYTEEILGELEDVEIELLRKIDEALERIENGTYGICEICGKEIEKERLKAIPWTTLCIEHAKEMESQLSTPDTRYKEYFDRLSITENPISEEEAGEL